MSSIFSMRRFRCLPIVVALLVPGVCRGGDDDFPSFVGRQACLECHAPEHIARPCSLEAIPAHERAWETLGRPTAEHIAALSGVGASPRESRLCLGCHATSADEGPRWTTATFAIADGVQCEACHGAGSLHVDVRRRESEPDALDPHDRMRAGDRADCAACHIRRPSHEEVVDRGYRRPETDKHYLTPVNLAVSPDGARLYVVCENRDQVAVVDPASGAVRARIDVGRRPHDAAVSLDGAWLYVTNRLSDTLSVIDTRSAKIAAEIAVGDEPHGVLTDAAGERVFVLNTGDDSISIIDAREQTELIRLATGRGPWSLAFRDDGETLCVTSTLPQPALFREPPRSELTLIATGPRSRVVDRPLAPDANMLQGIALVPGRDVVLFTMMRTKNLVPVTRLGQGWAITNGLGILWPDGRVDQVLLDEPGDAFPDPIDVAVSPDGRHALVTSGGTDRVAVVDVNRMLDTVTAATAHERSDVLPNHLGTSRKFVVKRIAVGVNPRGVAFAPDGRHAYVANALGDTVSVIETASMTVVRDLDLGGPDEITETRWGERLFFSAENTGGRQFSCSSCHPDGHVNGLTFDIEPDGIGMSPVDNRTLRGIFDTAPFKWEGHNPTLHRQCGPRLAVFFTRVHPYTPAELDALVQYISTIERPPNRHRRPEGLTLVQRRGKAIFERTTTNYGELIHPEQRCSTCHIGVHGTSTEKTFVGTTMWFDAPVATGAVDLADLNLDIEQNAELGLYYYVDSGGPRRRWDVPHLTNLYDSPPYLHNGAAATLEEIWTRYDVLMLHGVTSDLTRQQLNDLIAYLKTR